MHVSTHQALYKPRCLNNIILFLAIKMVIIINYFLQPWTETEVKYSCLHDDEQWANELKKKKKTRKIFERMQRLNRQSQTESGKN